jgi:CHAT domain-containing protein/Tfp pilus assembly protein PilF
MTSSRLTTVCTRLAIAGLSIALLPHATPAHRQGFTALEPGKAIKRPLARGEAHRYQIRLGAGELEEVIVEQHGIDLIVDIRDSGKRTIADVDDEIGRDGREQVALVAIAEDSFTLTIKAARGAVLPGSYTIRAGPRGIATENDRSFQASLTLRTAAARLENEGRFDEARSSLERALTLTESARGPDDVQVAAVAAQLAGVHRKLADGASAECLYERAIAILENARGAGHPATAWVRAQLAALYQREGKRRKAEALLRQALAVIEKTLGAEHPWFVGGLATLGNLRDSAGDLEEEEIIIRRALSIAEEIGDTESIQYASLLNNLGEVRRQKEDYVEAEALFQRSLALGERLLGPANYTIATPLQNLGIVARERKDYATAVAYNVRALSIRERTVGPNHPDVAHVLTNLANIYRSRGEYTRSLETHLRALRIWEDAAGPYQRATLLSVGNIAKTYAAMGDIAHAVAYQRRSDAIVETQLTLNLAVGSERQKLMFVQGMSERTDRTISLHLRDAPNDADAGALAAVALLQRKGRVLDAMIDTFAAVRQRIANASDKSLLDRLNATTAELARLALSPRYAPIPEVREKAIKDLAARKERLEAELAEHSAEFRAQLQPVTLEGVRAAISDDSALLEFTIFRPFDPQAERNSEAYAPPHYAAYVVRRGQAPRGFDLGPAAAIDAAIDALRQALREPKRTDVNARARVVDEYVMQPVRASLGGATRLLVSPDGELNLVPFDALVDEHGRYLVERFTVSYLTSGRDLLRMQPARANHRRPIIFADPVFGEPATNGVGTAIDREAHGATTRRSVTTGVNLSALYFAPLAATAEEGRAIKGLFPDATLFIGERATKAALQSVQSPRMLHIASHGFFLQDTHTTVANPLLRSGLAFAGANLTHGPPGAGMLTALEASGLDLWGTKLVTLSACDTGIGEVRNGEGVYGLRRAFVLAGAETVVMSLWPVRDAIARETMVAYYSGLRRGLGRGDALRQAKLAMLKRTGRQHPFYWASFIQSGEWANLDGRR